MSTTVHSLLALYGALDEAVLAAGDDSETAAVVERYLPGTTGTNAGWFREIRSFLDIPPGDLPPFENVSASINAIIEEQQHREDEEGGTPPTPLTKSELSRLTFVIGVLSRLPDTGHIFDEALTQGLKLAVPPTSINEDEIAAALFNLLQDRFGQRDDWTSVMNYAVGQGWIDPLVARVPLCRTRIKQAHGHTCVVLTTEFTRDTTPGNPSLDDLKSVVDPLNWHHCLSFFCDMRAQHTPDRTDGWRRVLEVTSTTCKVAGTPVMKTPLKYWLGPSKKESEPVEPLVAWVNYELDDTPGSAALGNGLVLVDEGFIKMYSTNLNAGAPGVRVVTKKVVCFRYLSEVAIAILACVSGYGNQGMDMLLDGIQKRRDTKNVLGWTDWSPSEPTSASSTQSAPGEGTSVPSDPNRASRRAIVVAVDMMTECIDEFSTKSNAVAGKLATGAMPIPEMITLSTEFAARLATDPWRYLERLRDVQRGDK
jgi:hypothetical protein